MIVDYEYELILECRTVVKGKSPQQVKNMVLRAIMREGFNEKDFSILISRIKDLDKVTNIIGGKDETPGD